MHFPKIERVLYNKNPLDKVICQVRYPTLLKIASASPVEFQEAIRQNYPIYSEKRNRFLFPPKIEGNLSIELISNVGHSTTNKIHEFVSANDKWSVSLSSTSLTLLTREYERWEIFREKFMDIFNKFCKIYTPSFFTRLGLQYFDIFDRASLGLNGEPWCNLLQEYILGLLSTDKDESINDFESKYYIPLDDGESNVRVLSKFVLKNVTNDKCFLIDSDFSFFKRCDINEVCEKFDFLNSNASRLIRWIIKDKLHEAMMPQKIENVK